MRELPTFVEERRLWAEGYKFVAGVDEVGRGPLAGPVVAAAVILPSEIHSLWLNQVRDSKQLAPGKREHLYTQIQREALALGVAQVPPDRVDALGIGVASREAMNLAIQALSPSPDFVLVDAFRLSEVPIAQKSIIKGDRLCVSIAAASIMAKVTRDRLMVELDRSYPGYGFARHKGYATKEHLLSLRRLGVSPVHRRSFEPVRALVLGDGLESVADGRRKLGRWGEKLAADFLCQRGYVILETNYRCVWGEIDIVAQQGEELVFVEVRTRKSLKYGPPEESLTVAKGQRLVALADAYIQSHEGLASSWRIDVVVLEIKPNGSIRRIELLENAWG